MSCNKNCHCHRDEDGNQRLCGFSESVEMEKMSKFTCDELKNELERRGYEIFAERGVQITGQPPIVTCGTNCTDDCYSKILVNDSEAG